MIPKYIMDRNKENYIQCAREPGANNRLLTPDQV
jgi:hypothetical protein